MHSLKSTAVAVMLLALSIGLYQLSSDENQDPGIDLTADLNIDMGSDSAQDNLAAPSASGPTESVPFGEIASSTPSPSGSGSNNRSAAATGQARPAGSPSFEDLRRKFHQSNPPARSSSSPMPSTAAMPFAKTTPSPSPGSSAKPADAQVRPPANRFADATNTIEDQFAQGFQNRNNTNQHRQLADANPTVESSNNGGVNHSVVPELGPPATVRQPIDTDRDNGLIQALEAELNVAQGHSDFKPSPSGAPATNDFSPELGAPAPTEVAQTNPQPPAGSGAKPSAFKPTTSIPATELVAKGNSTDGGSGAKSDFQSQPIDPANQFNNVLASNESRDDSDFQVHQANIAQPDFSAPATPPPASPPFLSPTPPGKLPSLEDAFKQAREHVGNNDFLAALKLLTKYYHRDSLSAAQRKQLYDWLDPLAGKVIYSPEHHFQPDPYVIRIGETLNDIAERWKVPAQVVYNINRKQIGTNANVVAGTELKMVEGPFRAEVDISSQTLTLFLNELYAGRFPVRLGVSGEPSPGTYQVIARSSGGHTWRDADGNDYAPEDPENGYGPYWLGLTNSLCIHAIQPTTKSGHPGCIGLMEKDARDIFGILANQSEVKLVP